MFEHRTDEQLQARCYVIAPSTIDTVEKCAYWGGVADRGIQAAEQMIAELKQYKMQLYDRTQALSVATWHYELLLERKPEGWKKPRVYYYLQLLKVYDDIDAKPELIENTKYHGADRRKAIADFEAQKKAHPGIVARMEIEKRSWER